MKLPLQILLCALWAAAVFFYISHPPAPPPPFPAQEEGGNLIPARNVYNPELAAAVDPGLRDFWQQPDRVLDMLGDLRGLKVADIGCGEGYFTLPLLERVGDTGFVFATDIQAEVLRELEKRIPEEARDRIAVFHTEADHTGIPQKVDLILLVQVLGEVDNQRAFLREIKNVMHKDSRLILIDSKHITDGENGFTRPLNLERLQIELGREGFRFDPDYDPESFDFLPKQFYFVLKILS